MSPSDLKTLFARFGVRPIRDRGQHFLLDDAVVGKMCDAAGIASGDRVVEIGPGPGILTEELLRRGAHVTAIELDKKMVDILRDRFEKVTILGIGTEAEIRRKGPPDEHLGRFSGTLLGTVPAGMRIGDGLTVIHADARSVRNAELGSTPYKVVANLPYGITSATIEKFLLEEPRPVSITLMIQREVAERVAAKAGSMSLLAVLCQALAEVAVVARVPSASFLPPPKVDSAVVHFRLRSAEESASVFRGASPSRVFSLTAAAFAASRKQLKNTLRAVAADDRLAAAFAAAKVRPESRPEELRVEDWVNLAKALVE